MGKKAVYMIETVEKSPFKDEIYQRLKTFSTLRKNDDREQAADEATLLADLVVQHLKHYGDKTEENVQKKMVKYALQACEYAHPILVCRGNNNVEQLRSCLYSQIMIHSREACYDQAIDIIDELIPLLNSEKYDIENLHEIYHDIAGVYFYRGNTDNAKYDDFNNALRFYNLERRILDTLPEDFEDLKDLKRSSDLNMGILEAKEIGSFESGINLLAKAYVAARELENREEQRVTVWELGNAYRNHGKNPDELVKVQEQELTLIRRYKLEGKEVDCVQEMLLTQLDLGNYDKSRELLTKLQELLEDYEDSWEILERLSSAIKNIEARRLALAHQPEITLLAPVYNRAVLYLELGEEEFNCNMLQSALKSAENGIKVIEKDSKLKEQLAGLLIDLMQLKANVLWRIRQSSIEEIENLNEAILGNIRLYCQNMEQRLENLQEVYERMADLFYYFDHATKYEAWNDVLEKCERKLDTLEITNESMRLGAEDEVLNGGMALINLSEVQEPMVDLSKVVGAMDPILTVRVALLIDEAEKIVFVDVYSDTKCIDWLIEQVAQKTWECYGYEPIIYALQTKKSGTQKQLNSQDLIIETISGNFERVDALYKGFREKTLLELYQNACVRRHVPTNNSVELALENQAPSELLLPDACLVSDDVKAICDLFRHMKPVTRLDLSGNVLYDHDIVDVFRHIENLQHVDLSSNRITLTTLLQPAYCRNLQSLVLSFNPLGGHVLPLLPTILSKFPRLESLDIESCNVTYTPITDNIREQYQNNEHRLEHLNVIFNEIREQGLQEWEPLLESLVKSSDQLKL